MTQTDLRCLYCDILFQKLKLPTKRQEIIIYLCRNKKISKTNTCVIIHQSQKVCQRMEDTKFISVFAYCRNLVYHNLLSTKFYGICGYSIYIFWMNYRLLNSTLSIQKKLAYEEKLFVVIQLSTNFRLIRYDLRKLTKERKAIVISINGMWN